jgi:hypothetical protein
VHLKKFESLSGALFCHSGGGDMGREAACIIVQYQMDNGRELLVRYLGDCSMSRECLGNV